MYLQRYATYLTKKYFYRKLILFLVKLETVAVFVFGKQTVQYGCKAGHAAYMILDAVDVPSFFGQATAFGASSAYLSVVFIIKEKFCNDFFFHCFAVPSYVPRSELFQFLLAEELLSGSAECFGKEIQHLFPFQLLRSFMRFGLTSPSRSSLSQKTEKPCSFRTMGSSVPLLVTSRSYCSAPCSDIPSLPCTRGCSCSGRYGYRAIPSASSNVQRAQQTGFRSLPHPRSLRSKGVRRRR